MGLLIRGLRHWCRDHRQGITPVDDLSSRIVYSQDFVGGDGQDHYGHGEHIAGIVAANGISSSCPNCTRSLVGIAPGARLINLRALDENGNGSDSTVIAAIEQAIRLKNQYNIRVMNLSLGRPVFESFRFDPLCQAVEAAWRAGIVVVVAAGNGGRDNSMGTNGYGTITVPGNDPYVITVGAMKAMGTFDRTDDRIASYSSKGPTLIDHVIKPDLVAPGNQVVSLRAPEATLNQEADTQVLTSYYQNPTPGAANVTTSPISMRYSMLNGTSMAAAVTSAAVADLLSAQPNLTPEQVKARLMKTAYKTFPRTSVATDPVTGQTYESHYDIFTVGAGYLDLQSALANHDVARRSALSPTAILNPLSGNIFLSPGLFSLWNDGGLNDARGVWGTQAVWGTAVIDANRGSGVRAASGELMACGAMGMLPVLMACGGPTRWTRTGVFGEPVRLIPAGEFGAHGPSILTGEFGVQISFSPTEGFGALVV